MEPVGWVIVSVVLAGWLYIAGTFIRATNFERLYRIVRMSDERLVKGESEANQSLDNKS